MALLTFFIVQPFAYTNLTTGTLVQELSSENLLAILAPLMFVYGIGLFFIALDQLSLPMPQLRFLLVSFFVFIVSIPLVFTLLPPQVIPIAYPPYYPPLIREASGWMNEDELMMSDIPWAVAWYGDKKCTDLTLDYSGTDFFHLNDDLKPVQALYLTAETIDSRFLSDMIQKKAAGWGELVLRILIAHEVPKNFPLRKAPTGFTPSQIFLTDWERWKTHPGSAER